MSESTDRSTTIRDLSTGRVLATRRDFLRLIAMGGAVVVTGGFVAACEDSSNTGGLTGPGTGASLTIDFAKGDVALLQYLYLLTQFEADFYSRVVANFSSSDFTSADQLVLTDIANHQSVHRDVLAGLLGADAGFRISPLYGLLTFRIRTDTLAMAVDIEDRTIGACDGVLPYFLSTGTRAVVAKLASVDARHSAALRDLISPLTTTFAPSVFEPSLTPAVAATQLQPYLEDKLAFPSEISEGNSQSSSDVTEALQTCLLMAQLQADFYQRALSVSGLIPSTDVTVFNTTSSHETSHVATLQTLIASRGGIPRSAPAFDYTAKGNLPAFAFLPTQYDSFKILAQALEDAGVRTWLGQLATIAPDKPALTSGASMHAVQARHASEVRRLRGKKGWVTGNNRDDLPAFMQGVYDGEDNTVQAGVDALSIASAIGGSTTATEAFDEALTTAQTMAFLAYFLP